MQKAGQKSPSRKQSPNTSRLFRGPVPGAKTVTASDLRQALRRAWQDNRHLGDGAIVASMAEVVSLTRLTARNTCEALRADLDAQALMQDGLRRGWLQQAA